MYNCYSSACGGSYAKHPGIKHLEGKNTPAYYKVIAQFLAAPHLQENQAHIPDTQHCFPLWQQCL